MFQMCRSWHIVGAYERFVQCPHFPWEMYSLEGSVFFGRKEKIEVEITVNSLGSGTMPLSPSLSFSPSLFLPSLILSSSLFLSLSIAIDIQLFIQ